MAAVGKDDKLEMALKGAYAADKYTVSAMLAQSGKVRASARPRAAVGGRGQGQQAAGRANNGPLQRADQQEAGTQAAAGGARLLFLGPTSSRLPTAAARPRHAPAAASHDCLPACRSWR